MKYEYVYDTPAVFQVLLSAFIGPNLVYYTLVYWVYPMKDYIGETGCHIMILNRNASAFGFQLSSLSVAIFRYICLFHSSSMRKVNLSPHVSCIFFSKEFITPKTGLTFGHVCHGPVGGASIFCAWYFLEIF